LSAKKYEHVKTQTVVSDIDQYTESRENGSGFDVIVLSAAIHEINDTSDQTGYLKKFFDKASHLLKDGGRVIIGDFYYPDEVSDEDFNKFREYQRMAINHADARNMFIKPELLNEAASGEGFDTESYNEIRAVKEIDRRYYVAVFRKRTSLNETSEVSQADLYDKNNQEYIKATENDPAKRYLQYPESLRLVGDIKDKEVLDVGCGNGMFTRMMARAGAHVTAYDASFEQVKSAAEKEHEEPLGISYIVSDRKPIEEDEKYDLVSSIMVLPCAENKAELADMFSDAYSALKPGGKMSIMTLNPNFKRYDEQVVGRIFKKRNESKIDIDFVNDDGTLRFSIVDTYFSQPDIEEVLERAGFKDFSWEKLRVQSEGVEEKGDEYWDGYEDDCPYIGLVASK
jgi:2-polyprenyl-3-methyl-5-hydroxy-6-metoxy-1,4-benzoquinol methylase